MKTDALIWMLIVQATVTAIWLFLVLKVLRLGKKPKKGD